MCVCAHGCKERLGGEFQSVQVTKSAAPCGTALMRASPATSGCQNLDDQIGGACGRPPSAPALTLGTVLHEVLSLPAASAML